MPGYEVYYNIGSHTRWTAIVASSDIMLTNVKRIPSGRAIAAGISSICTLHQGWPNGRNVNNSIMLLYRN